MALGDVYKARFCCYTPSQIGLNVTHWVVTAETGVGASHAEIADKFNTEFAADYKAVISSNASYRGVGITKVLPLPVSAETANVTADGFGAGGLNLAPTQSSGIITIKDGLAGRAHRGRIYIPFPSADSVDPAGAPTIVYRANMLTLMGEFANVQVCGVGANTTTLVLGLYHRLPAPPTATIIAQLSVPAKFATQRRRGQYGKTNVVPF